MRPECGKQVLGKAGITSREDLRDKAVRALQRLADLPGLVMRFFHDPDLLNILR